MAEYQGIIYVKTDRNIEVKKPEVQLKDVAEIECGDTNVLARVKSLRIFKFRAEEKKSQHRITVSVMNIISKIHEIYPKAEIVNLGENDFIITYEEQQKKSQFHWLKAAAVSAISFTGAAFSAMTFNNDVDLTQVFQQIYYLATGNRSDGFTILELTYSLGIIVGILVFFNHFGRKRFSVDPTPIEVEMRLYENDLQTTMIENNSRKGKELNVDAK